MQDREQVVIRRTPTGWAVGEPADESEQLVSAMVLADLLAEDLRPGERPPRVAEGADENTRLRTSIRQLEHALAARVVIEQAIGVLAERRHTSPRDAFELLRKVARSRGMRVHELARTVVASTSDVTAGLPPELPAPRA